jgi:hypothetical protein
MRYQSVNGITPDPGTPFENFDGYRQPFLREVAPAPGYRVSFDAGERMKLEAAIRDVLPTDPEGRIPVAARARAASGLR